MPVSVIDPGPDGVTGNGDDSSVSAFNLDPSLLTASRQEATNIDGYEGTYKTLEFSTNKRFSQPLGPERLVPRTPGPANSGTSTSTTASAPPMSNFSFFGSYPTNPNERTDNEFDGWNGKLSGTVDAGWGINVTPVWKIQSGAPYGRFFNATLNYGTQIILAEPIGTRRQDTVSVFDFRAEKQLRFATKARFGPVRRRVQRPQLEHGPRTSTGARAPRSSKATTVLGPRIAKFGVKFDW